MHRLFWAILLLFSEILGGTLSAAMSTAWPIPVRLPSLYDSRPQARIGYDALQVLDFDYDSTSRPEIWNKMSETERWAANQRFLDRLIARGDDIILSNPVKNINDVSGAFRKELDYLIGKGFKLSEDGTRMIR